jgi:hypothetical protein
VWGAFSQEQVFAWIKIVFLEHDPCIQLMVNILHVKTSNVFWDRPCCSSSG